VFKKGSWNELEVNKEILRLEFGVRLVIITVLLFKNFFIKNLMGTHRASLGVVPALSTRTSPCQRCARYVGGWADCTVLLHGRDLYLSKRYDGIRAPHVHLHGDA
jgi:hypothetical protein